ncbi:MAG: hypothetical protein ACJ8AD_08845, partial [Gemmatimonadaceae bacterium]
NGISILSEAFSHDPFEKRVKATYAFVKELLSLVAERSSELTKRTRTPRSAVRGPIAESIDLRSALPASASPQPVAFEILARTGDSSRTEPGVPRGLRRTGEFRLRAMPVFDHFVPTLTRPLPDYYLVPAADATLLARLRLHGIRTERYVFTHLGGDEFVVDSLVRSPRQFQGHHEARLVGRWRTVPRFDFSYTLVSTRQPLGVLAAYLLDPESDDGFATWNAFDAALTAASTYPVRRATEIP